MAQVHNLVGTSRIASPLHKLDLRAISNILPNSKFEKQKFAAITIRLGQPVCTVLLFTSGKMVLTGVFITAVPITKLFAGSSKK